MNPLDYSGAMYLKVICGFCDDFRRVAAPTGTRDADGQPIRTLSCPRCGTDEQRRELFTARKVMPEIRYSDLTQEEQEIFKQWRMNKHHELDCLRWIEGRRYEPTKDEEFMAEAAQKLAEWKAARDAAWDARHGRKLLKPCIQCEQPLCPEGELFCSPACFEGYKQRKHR